MTNSWMNEDGEPIMDGAAWRFEQQLDLDSQADYEADHFYDYEPEEECDGDNHCTTDADQRNDGKWECAACGEEVSGEPYDDPDDDYAMDPFVMEDQWLDGSYEE